MSSKDMAENLDGLAREDWDAEAPLEEMTHPVEALTKVRVAKATSTVTRRLVIRSRTPSAEYRHIVVHSSHRGISHDVVYDRSGMGALDLVGTWPVDTAAVGVIRIGRKGAERSAPVAETAEVVGPQDRLFPWASVTKPVTALAVLVAIEEGTLSLDLPAGPPGSTIRHLLAHASGLGPDRGAPLAKPCTWRIYSNFGYDVLADVLVQRSGMSFRDYVTHGVLHPLGMSDTVFDPGPNQAASASPSGTSPGGTSPGGAMSDATSSDAASGLWGPLSDLLALATEWAVPKLISPESHALAISVAFPGLPGVLPGFGRFDRCDWGLGVEICGDKRPHWTGVSNSPATFGHFGRSGSFFWIDPTAGLACAGLADRAFGPWASAAWPALSDAVLAGFRVG